MADAVATGHWRTTAPPVYFTGQVKGKDLQARAKNIGWCQPITGIGSLISPPVDPHCDQGRIALDGCSNVSCQRDSEGVGYTASELSRESCPLLFRGARKQCADRKAADCPALGAVSGENRGYKRHDYTGRPMGEVFCRYSPAALPAGAQLIGNEAQLLQYLDLARRDDPTLEEQVRSDAFNIPLAQYCLASDYEGGSETCPEKKRPCPPLLARNTQAANACSVWYQKLRGQVSRGRAIDTVTPQAIDAYCASEVQREGKACACINALKAPEGGGNSFSRPVSAIRSATGLTLGNPVCWVASCKNYDDPVQSSLYTVEQSNVVCEPVKCAAFQTIVDSSDFKGVDLTQNINCEGTLPRPASGPPLPGPTPEPPYHPPGPPAPEPPAPSVAHRARELWNGLSWPIKAGALAAAVLPLLLLLVALLRQNGPAVVSPSSAGSSV